ncbi:MULTISPECIES: FtsW/RodA/SpoVE family cell cycle protein [unclassified Frigoribacterium]|jgi:cell division protein FtsW (lipid II flippase)|uniref:FtsW/RodA/SpoVE family cell cycle protein n=1 Tax=unclassified Frigoribacterium TaxID=2627005 RepID=UPI0005BD4D4D|nr:MULTISPECIES: FtsW/RodA/SpoVE family cell cycle protein [unclassified Frigoribacterium]KQN41157.1 cell division protein FtsW [Frigoribacterium sp. Leaf44]MBD8139466.1 FtsW/RodA/SpoVE family cell cycle protein [Frigoribacterium sp. CFBP 13605]MBD8486897.1 FtsW/RodA/SpoVE family cell cycle protein [Frigoribacterium sp. CFBP 8759]MBD8537566.1 FtsW/RodA/SpoVE family cell cycle protein [Frigoribacterium sp. CFBP 8751]NQW87572.1 FtsW/RodA/SpoVE family cell cycle protein [Frigoribacterium sp. VKM 
MTQAISLRLREPARLRNLELLMLLIACGVAAGAMVLVQLGATGEVDPTVLIAGSMVLGLALIFHVVLRVVAREADPFVMPIAVTLNGIGIAMIYRLDLAEGREGWGALGIKQMVWTVLAMVIALAVLLVIRNYRVLSRYRYIAMFVSIVLLLLPLLPGIGREGLNARVWIDIGPFSFQPGEIAKITLAIFFAGYLVTARDNLSLMGPKILGMRFPRPRDLGPILIVWLVAMGVLIFQRDLGTSLLYFGLFLVMIYVGTGRASWIVLGVGLFLGGALIASTFLGYVQGRFAAWLNPFAQSEYDAVGGSFQLVQGLFGLANGGLIGTGLGQGRPQTTPLAESDYIFASLGEELGLTGLFAILALYLLLVSRGFRIGFVGQDDFGRMLGVGVAFVVALQVFVVMGGVTRVIPLTGLTAPFLAAGGSSLVANWIIVALLLRLSDSVRNQPRLVIG